MRTYTIGEVATRTGFTTSALRYYERIGLVVPVSRTDAGYRLYDDHTMARLAFIDRAKQLGASLEEIIDLVGIWDGERCGPVQRRFHELVTEKIHNARRQVAELTAFASQLQEAASQLSGPPVDGPCGEGCACVLPSTAAPSVPAVLGRAVADAPIACTLDPGDVPARLADWRGILDRTRSRTTHVDGALRLELGDEVDLGELTRLVAAEQGCCAFFAFAITIDARGIGLEVRAPEGVTDLVDSMFGAR